MRILHAIQVFGAAGGAQSYVRRVVELQAAAGHELAVVHGDPGASAPAGVRVQCGTDSDVQAFARDFDPDVVHVHDLGLSPQLEHELMDRCRFVRSIHDLGYTCAAGTRYFRNSSPCTKPHGVGCIGALAVRGCGHRLDLRPVVAEYKELGRLLPRLRATPATVLHSEYMATLHRANGFELARTFAAPYFVELGPDPAPVPRARIVSFAGRIVRNKGLDVLLRAFARATDAWDGLVVCGDGWDLDACRRLASRLGIAAKVEFRGWTSREDTLAAIAASRVLAVPSRWPEPFGIVGLEAMALGRPVVATRGGGIPEWLDDEETGLLVPPGDVRALAGALTRVLDDHELAQRLGAEGRSRAARFSADSHLAALESIYARSLALEPVA